MVGECAWLKVKDVNRVGAFLDWGLPKDLLVPYNEQYSAMEVGKYYPVCVLLDNETNRIAASSKLYQFLEEQTDDFTPQQTVNLLIIQQTDLGFKAVINHTHLGLIFHSDVFQNLQLGQKIKGYIKEIRDDGKINLSLQPHTHEVREELSETILDYLKQNGGSTTLTDKSPPEEIYQQFQVSKSNYKKALGALYRQRIINIDKQKITLLDTTDQSANEPDKSP
jgi:predicted RNA-binding protein (virulence factor B family)